jgi:S-DNA-T family DNA segregation ATPase FtsK/SpoIIIE
MNRPADPLAPRTAVEIAVSDVRKQIYLADPDAGNGNASCAELGSVFHRSIATLLGASDCDYAMIFGGSSIDDWVAEIRDFIYRRELGPYLALNAAALHGRGQAVLDLWQATLHASQWLAELFWDHRQRQISTNARFSPRQVAQWFQAEVPLRLELSDPNWSQPVMLVGIADSVLSPPGSNRCVIEYKLGKTAPEADLCQTALYHWMLGQIDSDSLAVLSFLPEKSERLFHGKQLAEVHSHLKALIGKLAGVEKKSGGPLPSNRLDPATPGAPLLNASLAQSHADASLQSAWPNAIGTQNSVASPMARQATPLLDDLSRALRSALSEFGCEAKFVCDPIVGPTFIRFTLTPGRGVQPRKFLACGELVQVRLALSRPPVIQTGEAITIDLQRPDRQFINWGAIPLPQSDPLHGCARVLIGMGIDGQLKTADLSDSASYHLLVAGTSGSGKSEWLRTAVAGLIATNTPEQLRLIAIDPKRVAFHDLQGSPYLLRPVVFPDDQETDMIAVLDDLIEEMERRYAMLDGCPTIAHWIDKHQRGLPRIVCVCDEYADLMLGAPAQRVAIETRICRLSGKARASGIHLILATQQPSRKTITGAIQANLPGRVGLTMTSVTESRMMFGQAGAENLLMKGDLLYKDIGVPKRYQAVYLNTPLHAVEPQAAIQTPTR